MNTKKKEIISEWMLAVAKGMISVGCFGLFLKYLRETWWGVENAQSVAKWYFEPAEPGQYYNQDGDGVPPESEREK